jgi:hypothetical protein
LGSLVITGLAAVSGRAGVTLKGVGARGTAAALVVAERAGDPPMAEAICCPVATDELGSAWGLTELGLLGATGTRL